MFLVSSTRPISRCLPKARRVPSPCCRVNARVTMSLWTRRCVEVAVVQRLRRGREVRGSCLRRRQARPAVNEQRTDRLVAAKHDNVAGNLSGSGAGRRAWGRSPCADTKAGKAGRGTPTVHGTGKRARPRGTVGFNTRSRYVTLAAVNVAINIGAGSQWLDPGVAGIAILQDDIRLFNPNARGRVCCVVSRSRIRGS